MGAFLYGRNKQLWNALSRRLPLFQIPGTVAHPLASREVLIDGRQAFSSASKARVYREWPNYRQSSNAIIVADIRESRYKYDVNALTKLPQSYNRHLDQISRFNALGISPLFTHYVSPVSMVQFAAKYVLSYRFLFIYMARTAFQAVRPLLAFCVFGEIMKLILANLSGGVPAFFFSFVLAFEVLYFFLQCYISYTFLTMFFTVMF